MISITSQNNNNNNNNKDSKINNRGPALTVADKEPRIRVANEDGRVKYKVLLPIFIFERFSLWPSTLILLINIEKLYFFMGKI